MKIKNLEYMEQFYFEPTETVCKKAMKIKEEYLEVMNAKEDALTGVKTNSELAQEVLDLIHASINFLTKMECEELITTETEMFKHSIKLAKYLNDGKYKK